MEDAEEVQAVRVAEQELAVARAEQARIVRGVNENRIEAAAQEAAAGRARQELYVRELERTEKLHRTNAATQAQFDEAQMPSCLPIYRGCECERKSMNATRTACRQAGQTAVVFGRNLGDRQFRGRVSLVKRVMGDKTVFARTASERKDLDAVQVFIDLEDAFSAPVGLRVDVAIGPRDGR